MNNENSSELIRILKLKKLVTIPYENAKHKSKTNSKRMRRAKRMRNTKTKHEYEHETHQRT